MSADAAEYQASAAVVIAKAAYAYDWGITGKRVPTAVLDTGIDCTMPGFAGTISAVAFAGHARGVIGTAAFLNLSIR